jgi:hypothetical protein
MSEWGEKALAFNPNDIDMMMTFSKDLAECVPTRDREKKSQMRRAEKLVNAAFKEATQLSVSQKSVVETQLHYTLGLIYFHQDKLGLSQRELLIALKSNVDDARLHTRLGLAYIKDKKNDPAIEAFATAVFLNGPTDSETLDMLRTLWVQKNKSENGLNEYIETTGAKVTHAPRGTTRQFVGPRENQRTMDHGSHDRH